MGGGANGFFSATAAVAVAIGLGGTNVLDATAVEAGLEGGAKGFDAATAADMVVTGLGGANGLTVVPAAGMGLGGANGFAEDDAMGRVTDGKILDGGMVADDFAAAVIDGAEIGSCGAGVEVDADERLRAKQTNTPVQLNK